ncbi:hypothetical protein [Burkholderia sp. 9779_493]|nr:hypothetical protein [Burkholderia sp. 9779_493]
MKRIDEAVTRAGMLAAVLMLGACATKESGPIRHFVGGAYHEV